MKTGLRINALLYPTVQPTSPLEQYEIPFFHGFPNELLIRSLDLLGEYIKIPKVFDNLNDEENHN